MTPHNPSSVTEHTAPHPPSYPTHPHSTHPRRTVHNPYPPQRAILHPTRRTRPNQAGPRQSTHRTDNSNTIEPLPETQITNQHPDNPQPLLYQPVISSDPSNEPWGDTLQKDIPTHILRVLSRNVNTINSAHDFIEWKAVAHALHNYSVGVACLQETNTQWTPPLLNGVRQTFRKLPTVRAAIATSNSKDVTLGNYQPGGTCTISIGKWTNRLRFTEQDSHGLGRWSYLEFEGRDARRIIIVSGYRSCNQPTRLGASTFHDQQYRLLVERGHPRPDPRLQFLDDIIQQIRVWRHQKKAVLLCMDANDDVTRLNPKKGIGRLTAETDLVDLHHYCHPHHPRPPTYNRGQLTLDFCLGSPEFVSAITKTAILPFGIPVHLPGDHRALIMDFNSRILFGNALPGLRMAARRGVYSNVIPTVTKFSKIVGEGIDSYQIQERILTIENKQDFTPTDHEALDQIDCDLTKILVKADAKCSRFRGFPWNPDLHYAFLEHRYWLIRLSEVRTKRSFQHALQIIQEMLGQKFRPLAPPDTIASRLRQARAALRDIRRDALNRRKQYLNDLLTAATVTKNKDRKKLIWGLKQAEDTRRCFAMVRAILRPTTPGGLTYLKLPPTPNNNDGTTIYDTKLMEHHLLNHSRQHFRHAHGTPYMVPPLSDLLGFDRLTPFGDAIFRGDPIPNHIPIDSATRLLLMSQRSLLKPNEQSKHPTDFESLMKGFKKWPERTTTSPSGRHLGIYKSLLKDHPPKDPPPDLPPRTYGIDVMRCVYHLLQLTLKHVHVYERWKTVWNMYLEKKPGNPMIDSLRTLHLFEADYNLLLKWHSSQGFMPKSETHHRILESQGGGRAGHSAIDLACKKVVTYDYLQVTRTDAVDASIDVARCFDNMVEACENLSCRQHGADPEYLRLHAATQQQFHYHVKHANGVSTEYNQHSDNDPWYGAGQGAGDACPRWIVQANSLMIAYNTKAHPWYLKSPNESERIQQGLDMFVDDTDLVAVASHTQSLQTPITTVQHNLNLWNSLLQASGGELNPSKCVWFCFFGNITLMDK